jgi:hypothetical protein
MTNHDFRKAFSSKTNDQLLTAVTQERESYTAEAIQVAEAILKERGIEFQVPEPPPIVEKVVGPPKPFMPMVVGICFVLLAIFQAPVAIDTDSAMAINIFLNLGMRAVVVFWVLDLTNQFRLSKKLWVILGLIFGGWTLMVINIVIWYNPEDSPPPVVPAETESQKEPYTGHSFANCPACNFQLNGKEADCPGCGLSFNP